MLENVVDTCQDLLNDFSPAKKVKDYLCNRVSGEMINRFKFGYFPENKYLEKLTERVSAEELSELGIIYDRMVDNDGEYKKQRHGCLEHHNLMMPYLDVYGRAVALVGRSILVEEERKFLGIPKYKNTSFDKSRHLFGLYQAKEEIIKKKEVYVVEGQFDVISAHQIGFKNVVAIGGSGMSFEQVALLLRYTEHINLLFDNDAAGEMGMERCIKSYGEYAKFKKCKIPVGYKDIDEICKENELIDIVRMLK